MTPGPHRKKWQQRFSRLDMYFGGNNHGCQEYSKNVYKYTQADRLMDEDTKVWYIHFVKSIGAIGLAHFVQLSNNILTLFRYFVRSVHYVNQSSLILL